MSSASTHEHATLPLRRDQLYGYKNIPVASGLFFELAQPAKQNFVVFTLSAYQKEKYIFLQDLYVQYCVNDPTEYDFAMAVFGEVEAWDRVKRIPKFRNEYYDTWVYLAEKKRKRDAFKVIYDEATGDSRSKYSAAKFLIEEPWKDKRNAKTRAQAKKSTEAAAKPFVDDAKRLKEQGLLN